MSTVIPRRTPFYIFGVNDCTDFVGSVLDELYGERYWWYW